MQRASFRTRVARSYQRARRAAGGIALVIRIDASASRSPAGAGRFSATGGAAANEGVQQREPPTRRASHGAVQEME